VQSFEWGSAELQLVQHGTLTGAAQHFNWCGALTGAALQLVRCFNWCSTSTGVTL